MASKKIKLEKDDHNNDQDCKPTNSALNPIVTDEVKTRSRADEDTGLEPKRKILKDASTRKDNHPPIAHLNHSKNSMSDHLQPDGSEKQQAQQQLVEATSPTRSNQASSYQLPPRSDLNQPGSSSNSASNRAPLHQLQPLRGSLIQPGSSSNSASTQSPLHQLQPRRGPLHQPGSRSNSAFNQAPLHQLQPHGGSLNQPGSSSKPVIDRAAANKFLKHFDSLNLPGESSSPLGLKLQPFDLYVNQLGSVTVSPDAVGSHKRGRSTSTNVLLARASQDGENKGDSDNAKVPPDLLAQRTGTGPGPGPGPTSGKNITAGDESNRPVSIAAGEVLSTTDTDRSKSTTESDEIQGDKEKSDTSQDGNTLGNSSPR